MPGNIKTSFTVVTDTKEEAIALLKYDILNYIEYKQIVIDVDFLWFEVAITDIYNNHITWMFTTYKPIKLTDNIKKVLPDVPINYWR